MRNDAHRVVRMHLVDSCRSDDIEMRAVSPSLRCVPPDTLTVVLVSDLRELLATEQPRAVMVLLHAEDSSLLKTVNPDVTSCALVSYRQEGDVTPPSCLAMHRSKSTRLGFEDFTMDGKALQGVIDAAEAAGIEALWVDGWCYRSKGKYDHDDFCKALHAVITSVKSVIWLPRAKCGSRGEYGYRLWCTFEASCVEQLNLPVHVAGIGMSSFQRRVRVLGSFTPAIVADGTLGILCRLNLSFYVLQLVMLVTAIGNIVATQGKLLLNATFVVLLPIVWLGFRGTISQQVRLAGNARRVMRTMSSIRSKDFSLGEQMSIKVGQRGYTTSATSKEQRHARWLLQDLPWLPALDRRDTLVVQDLLGRIRPDLKLDSCAVRALALSAYIATRQSTDDEQSASLYDWLADRNIRLDATPAEQEVANALTGMTWLHGVPESSGQQAACLPWEALQHLGWTAAPGVHCALITPLGALAVPSPVDGRWLLSAATTRFLPGRATLARAGTTWLALMSVLRPIAMVLWWRYGSDSEFGCWIGFVIWLLFFVIWGSIVVLVLLYGDLSNLCLRCFWPLPIAVYTRAWPNALAGTLIAGGAVFWAELTLACLNSGKFSPDAWDASQMQDLAYAISCIQFTALLAYEAVLYTIFVVSMSRRAIKNAHVG